MRSRRAILTASALLAAAPAAGGQPPFAGPVEATVVKVLDGDTFLADAMVWPGHTIRINVRIRGIDAPEKRSRCDAERDMARQARNALSDMIGERSVSLSNIASAKYYGRVLADVAVAGADVGARMLVGSTVRPYGGGRRDGWC